MAKHTKSFDLVDTLSVRVDRIQRNFEPTQHQVESWRHTQISDAQAMLIFYSAFVDGMLDAPKEPAALSRFSLAKLSGSMSASTAASSRNSGLGFG